MSASQLTPLQLAAAVERHRDERPDKALMTNEQRREAGLMDRRQAAEHEHLASVPEARLAERSRGSDAEIWGLVFISGHQDCGGWTTDGWTGEAVVCACGTVLREPAEATP